MPQSVPESMPVWFHKKGLEMQLSHCSPEERLVIISSSTANLTIKNRDKSGTWIIMYTIKHGPGFSREHYTRYHLIFNDDELLRAFVKPSEEEPNLEIGDETILVCTAATAGKFARVDRHLNITCPGTGLNGDPNLSIFVTDEIHYAIIDLLYPQ
ncbi:hypothetical protein ACFL3E_00080 [Patescibacteria group bacterium]